MTKEQLAKELATATGFQLCDAKKVVDTIVASVREALLRGETVDFRGFGFLLPVNTQGRKARNIKTGETVIIPARKSVKFRISKKNSWLRSTTMERRWLNDTLRSQRPL